jgi:Protein of unknown function (DUF2785)
MEIEFWRTQVQSRSAFPSDLPLDTLTSELVRFLSSPDPELRDQIGYSLLVHWILDERRYSPKQLRALIRELGIQLFSGAGDPTGVFGRSFATVTLAAIVDADIQSSFLTVGEIGELLFLALKGFAEELDWRGYVPGNGWAHSVAHSADLLGNLASHHFVGEEQLISILTAISQKLQTPEAPVLSHHEPSRLAFAVFVALQREVVSIDFVESWLLGFGHALSNGAPNRCEAGDLGPQVNSESTLAALSLFLDGSTVRHASQIRTAIRQVLVDLGFVLRM